MKPGFRKHTVAAMATLTKEVQPTEIPTKLQELIDNYYNSSDDLLLRLARFHIAFKAMQPYADGNGRTARLILNLELLKNGYPLTVIKFSDRPTYYKALYDGDLAMCELFQKSLNDTYNYIKMKETFYQSRSRDNALLLRDNLEEENLLT